MHRSMSFRATEVSLVSVVVLESLAPLDLVEPPALLVAMVLR